jgi:hypothetical protein
MAVDPDMPILAVIARLSWRVAKPQPWGLHEYTVRVRDDPQKEADFVALFQAIQQRGQFERWAGRKKRYLHPGDDRKYWSMTGFLPWTIIINRMLVADDLDRLRREGQIPPQ